MSSNRFEKYLRKTEYRKCNDEKIRTLLVIGDSKVNCVKAWVKSDVERSIIWFGKGGLTTVKACKWLSDNTERIIEEHGYIDVCIWTGTCDITNKKGKFIYPSGDEQVVEHILDRYENVTQNLKRKFGIRISFTILEVPFFSVSLWNKSRGHANPGKFSKANRVVETQLSSLNSGITKLNAHLGSKSPRFSLDLTQTRKTKSRKNNISRFQNYNLLKDGVHPKNLLAQYWMKKIETIAIRECYI